jgi:hypothetical protein
MKMRDDNGQQQQEQEAEQQMKYLGVYYKLMDARQQLSALPLKKSGVNSFAKYQYFELGDFLPSVQDIFYSLELCSVISFTADTATLTIIDTLDGGEIVITSPMGSAALKGCHEVQNIGAVQTYQRRYLWVTAMEIVEHDALDASAAVGTDDAVNLIKAVRSSANMELLKSNYDAAIAMCGKQHHPRIIEAKDARKLQLTKGE